MTTHPITNTATWLGILQRHRRHILATAGFLLAFLLLLLPAPRSGSFLGSFDTLFVPALGDTVLNRVRGFLTGEFVGQAMYPADILGYGETAFGTGLIFMFARLVGASDVVALYLTQAILLALMALGMLVLAEGLTGSFSAGLLAGFIFSTSNFVWADIDNLPIRFYFFPLLCMHFFIRAMEGRNPRYLVVSGILGGVQAYFSMQVFAYQSMMLAVAALAYIRTLWGFSWRQKGAFVGTYLMIMLPILLFYLNTLLRLHPVDPWPRAEYEARYSLKLTDLLSTLPGKLITYPFTHLTQSQEMGISHSGFPGLLAPILAALGLLGRDRRKLFIVLISMAALILSLGTRIEIAGHIVESPLGLFYKYVPLAKYLRVQLRAYSVVLMGMSLLAAFGWRHAITALRRFSRGLRWGALAVVCAFVAAENISWPVNAFELLAYPQIPPGYLAYFRDKPDALILDLPSRSTTWPFYIDDIIYVQWQTKHERNILGGVNGYYPQSRIDVQRLTDKLPSAGAFRYFRRLGATHFVWHKSPFLVCRPFQSNWGCNPVTRSRWATEAQGPDWLDSAPSLRLVFEDDAVKIYELR